MNSQDELQFSYKIGRALNKGAEGLGRGTRDKLQAARQKALGRKKMVASGLSLAGFGQFASEVLLPQARTLALLSTLVLGIVGTYYWNHFQQALDNVEIDSALLSDDLPINAYLDRGFSVWLDRSSQ